MRVIRCDNCGKDVEDKWRDDNPTLEDYTTIRVEHNEDVKHFDACSWACTAELAMKRAAESVDGLT